MNNLTNENFVKDDRVLVFHAKEWRTAIVRGFTKKMVRIKFTYAGFGHRTNKFARQLKKK